jgi:hypothetical protein
VLGSAALHAQGPSAPSPGVLPPWDGSGIEGSVYVSLDSWVYPAFERLQALGYADIAFLGLRPWTRVSCLHILEETQDRLLSAPDSPSTREAHAIFASLATEFAPDEESFAVGQFNGHAELDRLYERTLGIAGTPVTDSEYLGQTIIDDYGRPFQEGFNDIDGFSARAEDVRLSLKVRGEYQHAPGAPAYPFSVAQFVSNVDSEPIIPPTPIPQANYIRLIDANLSYHILNNEVSFGKSEMWWGPGESGAMAWSDNAPTAYLFRINRVEPLHIPLLSDLLGPFRYDAVVGPLQGHLYPRGTWVQAQKINFKPTRNLELGFSRVVMWGGEGHVPVTIGSFFNSFLSFQNVPVAKKFSRNDPGARHSSFDFTYRLPFLRNWVTLYSDSIVHDDVSPISAPRRAAINPGIYISHFPRMPHLDLRVEGVSTDPPTGASVGGQFLYYEVIYKDVYTNKGFLLGNWIGREGKGGQAWLTYWLNPQEKLQLGYRNAKADKDYVPGGTTQNLVSANAVLRLTPQVELNAFAQYERWKIPVLAPGAHSDLTASAQLTWYPHLRWSR